VVSSTTVKCPEPTGSVSVKVTSDTMIVREAPAGTVIVDSREAGGEALSMLAEEPVPSARMVTVMGMVLGAGVMVTTLVGATFPAEIVCVLAGTVTVIGIAEPEEGASVTVIVLKL